MKKSVCVDLDGVLAQYDGWKGVEHIGDPIPGAVQFTKKLQEVARVVIFTTRTNADPKISGRNESVQMLTEKPARKPPPLGVGRKRGLLTS